jgi:hypothetical protein
MPKPPPPPSAHPVPPLQSLLRFRRRWPAPLAATAAAALRRKPPGVGPLAAIAELRNEKTEMSDTDIAIEYRRLVKEGATFFDRRCAVLRARMLDSGIVWRTIRLLDLREAGAAFDDNAADHISQLRRFARPLPEPFP